MASKEELLSSISPTMKLTKDFFKRIYGYEITWPGFADQALAKLEDAGCSRAREYYVNWVTSYEEEDAAVRKRVAHWYVETYERTVKNEKIQRSDKIWDLKNSHRMKYTEKRKGDLRRKLMNRNQSI